MLLDKPLSIFLELCSIDQLLVRGDLSTTLQRAGIHVLPSDGVYTDHTRAMELTTQSLKSVNCSVHILYPASGPTVDPSGTTLAKFQFNEAKKFLEANPGFRMFIWLPPTTDLAKADTEQLNYINEVRNSVSPNMVFSKASSSLQFAEDIRSQMEKKEEIKFDLNSTDIFLISNQLDENEANEIKDMLSDIVPVENLSIIQDSETDYSEFCKQQISKSRLAVVYFKMSGDWAVPFTQQVWKKIGGATSHTPILLIGDHDPESNLGKKFLAPKVVSLIVAGELIPLEIKVQFDKTVGAS